MASEEFPWNMPAGPPLYIRKWGIGDRLITNSEGVYEILILKRGFYYVEAHFIRIFRPAQYGISKSCKIVKYKRLGMIYPSISENIKLSEVQVVHIGEEKP